MAKSKFTVNKIEKMEQAVGKRYHPYYTRYPKIDHDLETSILKRAIYYLELGLTPSQVLKARKSDD